MTRPTATSSTLSVRVPFAVRKRGGRKLVVSPDRADGTPQRRRIDNTLVKALARAHRWQRMLESGRFTTIKELARHEGIAPSYLTRVLGLSLLGPDIVETILAGRQGPEVTLGKLMEPFPAEWEKQKASFEA